MKTIKVFIAIAITLLSQAVTAQEEKYVPVIEVKVAPVKLALSQISIGGEFVLNDRVGIEPILDIGGLLSSNAIGMRTFGKFYIAPKYGADRFYIGSYLKLQSRQAFLSGEQIRKGALGFLLGYKYVTDSGLILEAGYGLGRSISVENRSNGNVNASAVGETGFSIDGVAQFSIGYRFGTVKEPIKMHGKLQRKLKSE